MKQFPTLYARSSSGKILIWFMEQDENKYRTTSGQQDGKLITTEFTVAQPKNVGKKNETNGVEQATAEINSVYKKQRKTGYFDSVKDIDKFQYVEPILAKSYKDYVDEVDFSTGNWGSQTKFNGICLIATRHGLFSRKGERFLSVPHIQESLVPFFICYPNAVLHGEMFNDAMRQELNEIVKLCRKSKDISIEDLNRSKEIISFYIYDGYFPDVNLPEESPYSVRKAWIDKNVINKYNYCVEVKTIIINDKKHLDTLFGAAIERGDEGLILRKMDMPYSHKRVKTLLKYKPLDTEDAIITAIWEGQGGWTKMAAKATLQWGNKTFDATFKGTQLQKQTIFKNQKDWINKKVEFIFNGLTGLGIPSFARIDINNCTKE